MSQVRQRLAHTASVLGLMGALVVSVCAVFAVTSPVQAAVDKTMQVTYTCLAGGAFTAEDVSVTISAPETVTPGGTATVRWTFSAFAASSLAANTSVVIDGTLTVGGGGSPPTLQKSHTGTVASVSTSYTPSPATMESTVTAPSSGGPITITPGTVGTKGLKLTATAPNGGAPRITECTYKSASPSTGLSIAVQAGGGNNTGGEVVTYNCTLANNATDTSYPANVAIKVDLSTPTNATANANATITWNGTIESTGDPLTIPTGFPTTSPKMFATIKPTGAGAPATASGEAPLTGVTVGSDLTTLPDVTITLKPTVAGTVKMTAGDLAFGTSTTKSIQCKAPTTGLKEFSFTVASATSTGTSSPTASPTNTTPRPTTTRTSTVTVTPTESATRKSQTPKAGADTGAGGMAGPDGRLFVLVGTGLIGAAAVGGLVMRRRSIKG